MKRRTLENGYLTFMLIPHFSGRAVFSIRVKKWVISFAFYSLLLIALVVTFSIVYSSFLTKRMVNYHDVIYQNSVQQKQIGYLRKDVTVLNGELQDLLDRDQQLRGLLGLGHFNLARNDRVKKK